MDLATRDDTEEVSAERKSHIMKEIRKVRRTAATPRRRLRRTRTTTSPSACPTSTAKCPCSATRSSASRRRREKHPTGASSASKHPAATLLPLRSSIKRKQDDKMLLVELLHGAKSIEHQQKEMYASAPPSLTPSGSAPSPMAASCARPRCAERR